MLQKNNFQTSMGNGAKSVQKPIETDIQQYFQGIKL
jgi:hypothetical protein